MLTPNLIFYTTAVISENFAAKKTFLWLILKGCETTFLNQHKNGQKAGPTYQKSKWLSSNTELQQS